MSAWGQFAHDSHHSSRYGAAVGGLAPGGEVELFVGQNAPNPFNPMTRISYGLPNAERVRLIVYDVRGRAVRRLVSGWQSRGDHEVAWDGTDDRGRTVGSGVYLYRLEANGTGHTKKMLLLR